MIRWGGDFPSGRSSEMVAVPMQGHGVSGWAREGGATLGQVSILSGNASEFAFEAWRKPVPTSYKKH